MLEPQLPSSPLSVRSSKPTGPDLTLFLSLKEKILQKVSPTYSTSCTLLPVNKIQCNWIPSDGSWIVNKVHQWISMIKHGGGSLMPIGCLSSIKIVKLVRNYINMKKKTCWRLQKSSVPMEVHLPEDKWAALCSKC